MSAEGVMGNRSVIRTAERNDTALVRIFDMIHVRGCRHSLRAASVLPWVWAEDKPLWEIAALASTRIRFCATCRPLNRTCNTPGPAGSCDRPHGHAGNEHSWSIPAGASAQWTA